MKIMYSMVLLVCLILLLLGCGIDNMIDNGKQAPSTEPGIVGYVMNKDNGRILVVSQTALDFSSTGGVDEYYNAIWFSDAPKDIEIGDKVKVWYDAVRESYPGQSEVKHIEVVIGQKMDGANLTEAEVLYKAIKSDKVDINQLLIVKSIGFDKQTASWKVELKENWTDKIIEIQIEDKS